MIDEFIIQHDEISEYKNIFLYSKNQVFTEGAINV